MCKSTNFAPVQVILPDIWSCGRVARQSSAKASTAVRIRSGPPGEGTKTFAFFNYDTLFKVDRSCCFITYCYFLFYALGILCGCANDIQWIFL